MIKANKEILRHYFHVPCVLLFLLLCSVSDHLVLLLIKFDLI